MAIPTPIRDFIIQQLMVGALFDEDLLHGLFARFPRHDHNELRKALFHELKVLESAGEIASKIFPISFSISLPFDEALKKLFPVPQQAPLRRQDSIKSRSRFSIRSKDPGSNETTQPVESTDPTEVLAQLLKLLTPKQKDVVQSLITAGTNGLNKDDLVARSGYTDAVNILKRVAQKPGWKDIICLPGVPGKKYRLVTKRNPH